MLSALTFVLLSRPRDTVADFFPTAPGTVWVYEEVQIQNGKRLIHRYTNTAETEKEIAGDKLVPISVTRADDENAEKVYTFYQITATDVMIAGFKDNELLETPYSVLKATDRKVAWKHEGVTDMLGATCQAKFDWSAEPIGQKTVLGQTLDTIEVKMKVQMEADGVKVTSDQTSWYAKGIGLIKLEANTQYGKQNYRATSKLVSYSAGP